MSVEVVSKKKTGVICKGCDHSLSDEEIEKKACGECGGEELKKSLVIVRKAVGDEEDDLETAVTADDVEDEESDDVDDEVEDESDDEEDEADDDDEEDEEEDEDEDDEEEEPAVVKSENGLRDLEVLNVMTACAEDVVKVFKEGGDRSAYEETMVELNNVMDAAAEKWFAGTNITKSADADGHATVIRERVDGIIGKEKKVAKKSTSAQQTQTITKREDLPEDVRKSLEAADAIVEENTATKWLNIAKGYANFPGDKVELAKTLRTLSESSPEAFESLKKTLDAAEEQLAESEVLKAWGAPGGTEDPSSDPNISKAQEIAKAEGITVEQAQVRLMDGKSYQPTA